MRIRLLTRQRALGQKGTWGFWGAKSSDGCGCGLRARHQLWVITAKKGMLSRHDLVAVSSEHTDYIRSRTVYLAPRSAMVQVFEGDTGDQTG